jgi:hypothetical protein
VDRPFALSTTKLLQFEFRRSSHGINLGTIVTLAAIRTFHPKIFSLGFLGHGRSPNSKPLKRFLSNVILIHFPARSHRRNPAIIYYFPVQFKNSFCQRYR